MRILLSSSAALLLCLAACAKEVTPVTGEVAAAVEAGAAPGANSKAAASADAAASSAGESGNVDTTTTSSNAALERLAALPAAVQLPAGKWVAGQHYRPLVPTQPTQAAPGSVEVVEVFWYACSHCYALEPHLASWFKNKPSYVEFVRLPVMWGGMHRAHARLYFTLEALGKLDQLHQKVFDEINVRKNVLATSNDEAESQRMQLAFARANGISESDFTKAWKSFGVESKLQRAEELGRRYKVEGVPLVVVNGKYVTDVGMAGSQARLIELINDLAASEKRR